MEPSPKASAPPAWDRRAARRARADPEERSFGTVLRELREARDLSRKDLAGRSGLDQTYIFRLESGERGPSREAVDALVEALGASPADRMRLLLAADLVVPLDPLLIELAEVLWNEGLPDEARGRLEALLEVAVAYGRSQSGERGGA